MSKKTFDSADAFSFDDFDDKKSSFIANLQRFVNFAKDVVKAGFLMPFCTVEGKLVSLSWSYLKGEDVSAPPQNITFRVEDGRCFVGYEGRKEKEVDSEKFGQWQKLLQESMIIGFIEVVLQNNKLEEPRSSDVKRFFEYLSSEEKRDAMTKEIFISDSETKITATLVDFTKDDKFKYLKHIFMEMPISVEDSFEIQNRLALESLRSRGRNEKTPLGKKGQEKSKLSIVFTAPRSESQPRSVGLEEFVRESKDHAAQPSAVIKVVESKILDDSKEANLKGGRN